MTRPTIINLGVALLCLAVMAGAIASGSSIIANAPSGALIERVTVPAGSPPVDLQPSDLGLLPPGPGRIGTRIGVTGEGGGWRLASHQPKVKVVGYTPNGRPIRLDAWSLQANDRVRIATGGGFTVTDATADSLELVNDGGGRIRWTDGEVAIQADHVRATCDVAPASAWRGLVNRLRSAARRVRGPDGFLFFIGSTVNCLPGHWALPQLKDPEALLVLRQNGGFWLVARPDSLPIEVERADGPAVRLAEYGHRVGRDIIGITAGRTRFDARLENGALTLQAQAGGRDLLPVAPEARHEAIAVQTRPVRWIGDGAALTAVLADEQAMVAVTGMVALLLPLAAARFRRGLAGPAAGVSVIVCMTILNAIVAMHGPYITDLSAPLLLTALSWGMATVVLAAIGRLSGAGGILWLCMAIMAAYGGLVQLGLAAASANEARVATAARHAVSLSALALVPALIGLLPAARHLTLIDQLSCAERWRWLRVALAVSVPLLLVAEAGFGSESGLGPLQPAELSKPFIALILAYAGTRYLLVVARVPVDALWGSLFLRLCGIVIALVGPISLSLVAVQDFSPIIIIAVQTAGVIFAFAHFGLEFRAQRGRAALFGLLPLAMALLVVMCSIALVFVFRELRAELEAAGVLSTFMRRILAFEDPLANPALAWQVISSFSVIAKAPLWWPGEEGAGLTPDILRVPLVESDFAATAVVAAGVVPATVLAVVNLLYVLVLMRIGWAAMRWGGGRYGQREAGMLVGLLLVGCASSQAMQFVLAWSNSFSFLPVTGQPLSVVSQGNNHVIASALPILLSGLIGSWIGQSVRASQRACAIPQIPEHQPEPVRSHLVAATLAAAPQAPPRPARL